MVLKPKTQKEFDALVRSDLSSHIQKVFNTVSSGDSYLHNWHIDAIAHALTKCLQGKVRRLIITMPPRYMKSISASVAFPAFILGNNPSAKIICASYSQDLALKHAADCKLVMESPWYRKIFGVFLKKNTQSELVTILNGFRLTTSVGGPFTGLGGDVIIIDDPHKADEVLSETKRKAVIDWFNKVVLSRLNNKKTGIIIVIQQRLHENDLAGYLLEKGGWDHLNLPAIAEEEQRILIADGLYHTRKPGDVLHEDRESRDLLEQMLETMGSHAFAAQYQQRPTPLEGGMVHWDWFKTYDHMHDKFPGDLVVQSWDTASKVGEMNDYSVCTTWLVRKGKYYLLHVLRERLEFPNLKAHVIKLAHRWKADIILIEAINAGVALAQDLAQVDSLNIVPITPKDDKATRMMAESPKIEGGHVFVPKDAPWLADFQHEVTLFPMGKHDDQIDSLSQFLYWAKKRELQSQPLKCHVTLVDSYVSDLYFGGDW